MLCRLIYYVQVEINILVVAVVCAIVLILMAAIVGQAVWLLQGRRCASWCRSGVHDIHRNIWKRLAEEQEVGSVLIGIIGALLWLPVILLEILFAASLLEVLIPGGQRIQPDWAPGTGQYRALSLVAAMLLACFASFVAIILGNVVANWRRARKTDPSLRPDYRAMWLFLLCTILVVFQFGMAVYRAVLIGSNPGLPSVFSDVMAKGGPWVAGLLGLIIPVVEMICAEWAFQHLIIPFVRFTVAGVAWGLAGWHEPLPGDVSSTDRMSRDVLNRAKVLTRRADSLEKHTALSDVPPTALNDTMPTIFTTHLDNMTAKSTEWFQRLDGTIPLPVDASPAQQERSIRTSTQKITQEHRKLMRAAKCWPRDCRHWNWLFDEAQNLQNQCNTLKTDIVASRARYKAVQCSMVGSVSSVGVAQVSEENVKERTGVTGSVSRNAEIVLASADKTLREAENRIDLVEKAIQNASKKLTDKKSWASLGVIRDWINNAIRAHSEMRRCAVKLRSQLLQLARRSSKRMPFWKYVVDLIPPFLRVPEESSQNGTHKPVNIKTNPDDANTSEANGHSHQNQLDTPSLISGSNQE